MYTEPQVVTVNGVAKSLPRTAQGDGTGTFSSSALGYTLKLLHSYGKRNRITFRLDYKKVAADPFVSGVNREFSMSAFLIVDTPTTGFTTTEIEQVTQGLVDWLDTPGNLTKAIGGES
jgi:hypothetical protein